MGKRIAILALLLLTAAGCGAGSTSETDSSGAGPSATAGEKDGDKAGGKQAGGSAKVGQTLRLKGESGSADVTVLSAVGKPAGTGDIAEKPANGQYVVVDIQFKAVEKKFEVNPLYVRYQAGDGKTFESGDGNALTAGFEPELTTGAVPAGQMVRGVVVFDVPAGKGRLVQVTNELGDIIGTWEL